MATDELLEQGLASIGLIVKANSKEILYAQKIGDIGADNDGLETTCFKDAVETTTPGVQKLGNWTVDFLYDNNNADSDYRRLKALEEAKTLVPIEVTFPDGTKFSNAGKVSVKITGPGVNEIIKATATFYLQKKWAVTDPASA